MADHPVGEEGKDPLRWMYFMNARRPDREDVPNWKVNEILDELFELRKLHDTH